MEWLNRKSVIDKIFILIGIIAFLLLLSTFVSCDILKKTTKTREDRTLTESTETLTKRKGDTVRYQIPKVTYKDTTIVKRNYVTGTTQTVRYNDQGMIDLVECQSGAIDELKRTNKELVEAINNKDKTVEKEFNTEIIIYIMLGFVFIVAVLAFFVFKYISKNTALVQKLIP